MTVRVRPEARADLLDAARWYDGRRPGLGSEFIDAIDAVFVRIDNGPLRYRAVHLDLRVALCRRFPYAVYFQADGADVIVFGVLHQRRDHTLVYKRLDAPA
jgi:plasmid stabilization system protein ParE